MIKEQLSTPITKECDVIVCGGGFGGISAALSAARHGAKVILLEKEYILGGLGTAGLITIYLALCDGNGKQVSFGIAEELLKLSVSLGHEGLYPMEWFEKKTEKKKRYEASYNPSLFAILAEKLLEKEGVEILYGSYAVATDTKDDKINAVIIENKSGRQAIKVNSVVDATGDCDIAHFSGAPTQMHKKGNKLAAWYYGLGKNGYALKSLGSSFYTDNKNETYFTGINGEEISDFVRRSHDMTLNDVLERRKNDNGLVPTSIATIPQFRMTRKIIGEYILDEKEVHKYFEDSIGMVSDWRKAGPVFEVPFRTLYSKKIKNLITAGRCTSVTDDMWDIMRVIPCCAVTGQAAGTAAAISSDFTAIDLKQLQSKLKQDGVILHEKDI